MSSNLKKNILIIGASGDIGLSISETLLKENLKITLHYNSNKSKIKRLSKKYGQKIKLLKKKLNSELDSIKLIKKFKSFGNYYAIIICSGLLEYIDFDKLSNQNLQNHFLINSFTPFYLAREFTKNEKNKLKVIFLTSVSPRYYGSTKSLHYSASKIAMENLLLGLGKYRKKNVSINGIRCGLIKSKMMTDKRERELKKRINLIPLKRPGRPGEISSVVKFLLSEDSSFVHNSILDVTGGD